MTDDPQRLEASAGDYPWFRFFASEFAMQTIGLRAIAKGLYITLLVMMHERGGPIFEEYGRISSSAGTTPAAAQRALEELLRARVVFRTPDGMLWSPAAERELAHRENTTKVKRENSAMGWRKRKEKQAPKDAVAYKSQNTELDIDPQAHRGPEESYTSHSPKGGDAPARNGAGIHPVSVNQKVEIAGLGVCYVDKIVSSRPFQFLVYQSDQSGQPRAYRVNPEKRRYVEISLDDAENLPDLSDEADNDRTA